MDRDEFMELVYETFADEPDNILANGIIEAADAYAEHEKAQLFSEGTTSDLISRQAAIEALARMMPRSYTPDGSHPADEEIFRAQEVFADCIEALEILPSAQPEIIRCKDCKYNVSSHKCLHPESFFLVPDDDFYCGYAKRRTDETD